MSEKRCHRGLGVVVGADEYPRVSADGDGSQGALGSIVCRFETAVVEVAHESGLVPDGVPERGAQETALVLDERELLLGPGEEGFEVRSRVRLAQRRAFGGRVALPLAFEGEDATEPRQSSRATALLAMVASQYRLRAWLRQLTSVRSARSASPLSSGGSSGGGLNKMSWTLLASACT